LLFDADAYVQYFMRSKILHFGLSVYNREFSKYSQILMKLQYTRCIHVNGRLQQVY